MTGKPIDFATRSKTVKRKATPKTDDEIVGDMIQQGVDRVKSASDRIIARGLVAVKQDADLARRALDAWSHEADPMSDAACARIIDLIVKEKRDGIRKALAHEINDLVDGKTTPF